MKSFFSRKKNLTFSLLGRQITHGSFGSITDFVGLNLIGLAYLWFAFKLDIRSKILLKISAMIFYKTFSFLSSPTLEFSNLWEISHIV